MNDDPPRCTTLFSKHCRSTTIVCDDAYPEYRRRSPNYERMTHVIRIYRSSNTVDNILIPYSLLLSLRYTWHVNIGSVHAVPAVKYLFMYLHKGIVRVNVNNRPISTDGRLQYIKSLTIQKLQWYWYQNARCFTDNNAIFKLLKFSIRFRQPTVINLLYYLNLNL